MLVSEHGADQSDGCPVVGEDENKKLSTSDIYQTFLYAYSLGDSDNPRAGIIYPSSKPGIQPRLGVSRVDGTAEAKISGIAIDLVNILNSRADRSRWATSVQELKGCLDSVLAQTANTKVLV